MITAILVGAGTPQLVQIVVDETPDGELWALTGSAASGYTWTVPGGEGIGDGEQLSIVDNRAPGNVPITYTFTAETVTEESDPITVPMGEFVLQSLDGQVTLQLELLDTSLDFQFRTRKTRFDIPGRKRPVSRYTLSGDREGTFSVMVPTSDTATFMRLFESGEPVLYRCGRQIFDFPLVSVIDVSDPAAIGYQRAGIRVWALPYVTVDDPFMDQRLGAFAWDFFDDTNAAREWDDFDALFAATAWDQFDTVDWTTL